MADRLAKLEKAYRRNPDSPLFARLADLYLKRGKTDEALEVCLRGCQHFPDYATGFMVLAQCYEVRGSIEQARDAIDQSLRLDPVNPRGYCRLSAIYEKLGVPTLALKSLQQAAELDPLADDLPAQVDELAYKVRLETARRDEKPSVESFVEAGSNSLGQVPNGDRVEEVDGQQADEPFAQVAPQGERSDEPDSAVLEADERQPSASFEPVPPPAHETSDDAPVVSAVDSDLAEKDAGDDGAPAGDDGDGWVRYEPAQDAAAEGADDGEAEEEISIFSPDNLPEDADIFAPQPSGMPAAAAGIGVPEFDEDEEELEDGAPAAQPIDTDPPETAEVEPVSTAEPSETAPAAEPTQGGSRYGEFDRETFAAVLSALKGANAPPAASTTGGGEGDEPFAAPVAADEDRSAEAGVPAADGALAEQAAAAGEGGQDVPPVDFGSLIAAMEGMGSSPRPAANPETEPERPPEASLVADDEPFVLRDDSAREMVDDSEPFAIRDEPEQEAVDRSARDGGVVEGDSLDLSDLRAPAQGRPAAETEPSAAAQSEDEAVASDSMEGADGATGRGAGLRARGDDELLRLFQEIETQGQDEGGRAPEGVTGQASAGEDEPEQDEDRQRITTLTLAEIYAIQGLNQKAIETYRDLLEQHPENDFIRRKLQDLENNSGKK